MDAEDAELPRHRPSPVFSPHLDDRTHQLFDRGDGSLVERLAVEDVDPDPLQFLHPVGDHMEKPVRHLQLCVHKKRRDRVEAEPDRRRHRARRIGHHSFLPHILHHPGELDPHAGQVERARDKLSPRRVPQGGHRTLRDRVDDPDPPPAGPKPAERIDGVGSTLVGRDADSPFPRPGRGYPICQELRVGERRRQKENI